MAGRVSRATSNGRARQAIELNLYRVPTNPHESGAAVEQRWVDTVRAVAASVSMPVAVKLGPWLSSPGHHALEIAEAGARGLVLFNRFYEPDIDLETLAPKPSLELSTPYEIRQALLWIALLAGRINASLAATSGVSTARRSGEIPACRRRCGDDRVIASAPWPEAHRSAAQRIWKDGWKAADSTTVGQIRGRLAAAYLHDREDLVRAQYIRHPHGL